MAEVIEVKYKIGFNKAVWHTLLQNSLSILSNLCLLKKTLGLSWGKGFVPGSQRWCSWYTHARELTFTYLCCITQK